jgi:uncharacterized protein YoxC
MMNPREFRNALLLLSFGFGILAIFGFFLVKSLTTDINSMSKSMSQVTDYMGIMTGDVHSMDRNVRKMTENTALMTESVGSMNHTVTDMSRSVKTMGINTHVMAVSVQNMERDMKQFTRPASFIRSFMPF